MENEKKVQVEMTAEQAEAFAAFQAKQKKEAAIELVGMKNAVRIDIEIGFSLCDAERDYLLDKIK